MRLRLQHSTFGLLSCVALAAAQTYTDCNPMDQSCPPDAALGTSMSHDFTTGASDDFTPVGSPTFGSEGAVFTVSKKGDSPLIQSNWYIMFGHVEFVIKAAPGTGIVSSAVLQSDNLDEIDWEWLGGNNNVVQTNYFGKGNTGTFNRAATHDNPGNHDDFHTYTIDWTSSHIVWQIDGTTVRVLTPESAEENQYPQTPMMVKVGAWAGGDPDNNQGTIDWAGGTTDYSAGPFSMYLKSIQVTDYSTGTAYSFGDRSGTWQSIVAEGGEVNGNSAAESMSSVGSAPSITATADSGPIPFEGTHRDPETFTTPDIYPWVPRPTSDDGSDDPSTDLPGGWNWAGSPNVQPPSRSSMSEHCLRSRVVPSSGFLLKRCVSPNQYMLPSTYASPHSSSDSSFLSDPEMMLQNHRTVNPPSELHPHALTASEEFDDEYRSLEQYEAATKNASRVFHVPLIFGAFCALLGSFVTLA